MFELIKSIESKYWVELDNVHGIYWIHCSKGIPVKEFLVLKNAYKSYEIMVN